MQAQKFFSVENICRLKTLKPGAKIHVIGVCGVAMAQISVLLSQLGYEVSGSDKEFYEPMGSLLAASKVRLCKGYSASNLPADLDLVVIGNAVSYGHEEVLEAERRKIPYTIFPRLLNELVIEGKHSIVVAGTHGKSTTSALMASVLLKMNQSPGYFVGGIANDLPSSLAAGTGKFSVVEGDEYDSAFFAKVPKFTFYTPDSVILTSIEYDHADIYPDLESVKQQFDILVKSLPQGGNLVCCLDDKNIKEMLPQWRQSAKCKIVTYGTDAESDFRIVDSKQNEKTQLVSVVSGDSKFSFGVPLPGIYNALNALAVLIVCTKVGLDLPQAIAALATFAGVKRRQEVRYKGAVVLIEDFAHHPTAVRETIQGVRKWFPKARLWAIFEPRSNTSRRKVFQQAYVQAFAQADKAILCEVSARSIDANQELLDVAELGKDITASGVAALTLPNADAIFDHIHKEIASGDVVLLMSNGAFGGLPARLENELKARKL